MLWTIKVIIYCCVYGCEMNRPLQLVYLTIVITIVLLLCTTGLMMQDRCTVTQTLNNTCYNVNNNTFMTQLVLVGTTPGVALCGPIASCNTTLCPMFHTNNTYWCYDNVDVYQLYQHPHGMFVFNFIVLGVMLINMASIAVYIHCTTKEYTVVS